RGCGAALEVSDDRGNRRLVVSPGEAGHLGSGHTVGDALAHAAGAEAGEQVGGDEARRAAAGSRGAVAGGAYRVDDLAGLRWRGGFLRDERVGGGQRERGKARQGGCAAHPVSFPVLFLDRPLLAPMPRFGTTT